ncbi:hypothetical protein [Mycobacterium avium]|uniref:hypothetical protein n=1 Tax=Mycobacterium avium TaxID=1764 RepID=UPI0011553816|nr:hypothetical protein [Mycobacterium avium]
MTTKDHSLATASFVTAAEHDGLFELPEADRVTPKPAAPKAPVRQGQNKIIPAFGRDAGFRPVPDAVAASASAAHWPGIVLPQLTLAGHRVYPMVAPNAAVWRKRLAAGQEPELDLSTLAYWESWTEDLGPMPPASALTIVGFLSDARPGHALCAIDYLGGLGAGIVVSKARRYPSRNLIWECGFTGAFLVWAPPDRPATLVVSGRTGPVHTARRTPVTRGYEEKLFAWALHTNARPPHPG